MLFNEVGDQLSIQSGDVSFLLFSTGKQKQKVVSLELQVYYFYYYLFQQSNL